MKPPPPANLVNNGYCSELIVRAPEVGGLFPYPLDRSQRDAAFEARGCLREAPLRSLRQPVFVRMVLAAALVIGSHAMHDARRCRGDALGSHGSNY
jgi:hypothetical protein